MVELPLPARAINALKNHEILMVADLVQKTDEDLESVKNLGSKSIEEIKIALAALVPAILFYMAVFIQVDFEAAKRAAAAVAERMTAALDDPTAATLPTTARTTPAQPQ